MVEVAVAEGESLLIFSQFTEVCESIEKHIKHSLHYNTYYLHGGTTRQRREKMIEEFQNPETEPSVFILSLKAGGVGITLTKANHVFHFDRWWNPAVEEQASDRAFRIGQKKNVFVHKFVTIGTLEEKIDQMIEDKKKLAAAVVGSDADHTILFNVLCLSCEDTTKLEYNDYYLICVSIRVFLFFDFLSVMVV